MMGYYSIVVCLGREGKKKEKKAGGVGGGNGGPQIGVR